MPSKLDVLITPADFEALKGRELAGTTCVVFDVLRATSSMVTALANGAAGILPVADILEALEARKRHRGILLAGERHGVRILSNQTGGVDFDLGNSPREFTAEKVKGRVIAMTTTNGTLAIRACAKASQVLVSALLNLGATVSYLASQRPASLLLVCGGTYEEAAYEDTLAAGAMADLLWPLYEQGAISDSVLMARRLYRTEAGHLPAALASSRNGKRLTNHPELRADVPFCAQLSVLDLVAHASAGGLIVKA